MIIFIDMNKGTISDDNINIYCDKYKQFLPRWMMPIVA